MVEATWYSQGAFSWAECSTTDFEGAKAFYSELFGLELEETPIPDGGVYGQFQKNGKYVAGLTPQQEQEREAGIPPHWNAYISVEDADLVAKEAEGLGGTIVAPAFDVLDSGRMAVVMDPTGAAICFWQAKDHIGAQVYAEDNTLGWFELMTPDPKRATEFYTQLFGYGTEDFPTEQGTYTVLTHKGENAAGIMSAPQPEMPAAWTPYFQVADADATLEKATSLGATVMMPVTEAENVGRFSWITDPQGAVVAFIEPAPERREAQRLYQEKMQR
jgi:predicted enzyme related to lactoylglutathione lyase